MAVNPRSQPEAGSSGQAVNPAANLAKEQISADQILQWTLEGKCYTASIPVETTSIAARASLADITPDYCLNAAVSGTKLIVPISTTFSFDKGNGSQVHTVRLVHVRPSGDLATQRTLSGTAMTITNNRSDGFGGEEATALYTATSSAITSVEFVDIGQWNTYSGHGESTNHGLGSLTIVINHLKDGAPIILRNGAGLFVYVWEGNGAALHRCTFTWAELDASVYL